MYALWKKLGGEEKQVAAVRGLVCSCVCVRVSTICEIEFVAKLIRESCNAYDIVCVYKCSA